MDNRDAEPSFLMVSIGDSVDARLFVELSSYASDLAEARHALDLATKGLGEGSPLAEARHPLVGLAVVAYCRTILHSNVRGQLTDHVDVPDDLIDVHNHVKAYRNATVAHSQSELAVTYAVGVLDARTLNVRDVMGPTILIPPPRRLIQAFERLIDAMQVRLDQVTDPVRARLAGQLAEADRNTMTAFATPEILEKWAHEFNPRTRRPAYPTGHTVYWESSDEGGTTRVE